MVSKKVAVWKRTWLPFSETFIRDQILALPPEWKAVKLGFHNLPDSIMRADYAPYPLTSMGKVLREAGGTKLLQRSYTKHIVDSGCQVVHAHFGTGGIDALPIARAAGLPLVTTFHGSDTTLRASRVPGFEYRYRLQLRRLFSRASKLIAVSNYLADRLIEAGAPSRKIEVLYTGTAPREPIVTPQPNGIVFVGRLIDIKGVDHLLKAASLLQVDRRRPVPITIVGEGPRRPYLEELSSNLGLDTVFMGRVPSDQVAKIIARHQILCGPSLPSPENTREGLGMVFLEAALQQVPAVAYASGGIRESVMDGVSGLLAAEGDINGLAKALGLLLDDESYRRSLGAAARERTLETFNLETNVKRLMSIYDSVM